MDTQMAYSYWHGRNKFLFKGSLMLG